ncbi:MAG: CDP-alcohol phosphatidyltransferase family protein [candidate division KSB1 bacterium]|nr:CDP-alcohol phosphatidyltransferase family protein [candidate division KSB1 bacterium]
MTLKTSLLPDWLKNWYLNLITPVVNFCIARAVNPNFFTTLGFIVSVISASLFVLGYPRWAGVLVLLSGTLDIIDGKVARATNRVTKFGALYDSTLDRYAEVVVFFGLAYFFSRHQFDFFASPDSLWRLVAVIAVSVALGGSMMVSYVRARAEGLGLECKVGIMQRPERIVLLGFGAILHEIALIVAVVLIALLSNFTAVQRLIHVRSTERRLQENH